APVCCSPPKMEPSGVTRCSHEPLRATCQGIPLQLNRGHSYPHGQRSARSPSAGDPPQCHISRVPLERLTFDNTQPTDSAPLEIFCNKIAALVNYLSCFPLRTTT